MNKQPSFILLIKVSVIALIIGAISLPQVLEAASPLWVPIIFIYWLIYSEAKSPYLSALLLGLLLDILQGGILGQNALNLVISSAFILNVKKSFFVSNLTTQQVYVFIASSIYLSTLLIAHIAIQGFDFSWFILLSPFTSAVIWPVIRFLIAKIDN